MSIDRLVGRLHFSVIQIMGSVCEHSLPRTNEKYSDTVLPSPPLFRFHTGRAGDKTTILIYLHVWSGI